MCFFIFQNQITHVRMYFKLHYIFPCNFPIVSCSNYINLTMKTLRQGASSLKHWLLNMKLGRSFSSVMRWVVLANKKCICSTTDSQFLCFGILVLYVTKCVYLMVCRKFTGNIQAQWNLHKWWIPQFSFKPPSTPNS